MILSKSQLVSNINNDISDQAYGAISPYDIRHNLLDIIDSIPNLTLDKYLFGLNFATLPSGTTKVGQSVLENFGLPGYNSSDNTAVGFSSLKANYQGIQNTAIGSQALSCNVYGIGNVAVGYNALGGNTTGHLNIGIGNHTLNNNKAGSGNIAIGHGAGYYVNRNTSNKLIIAQHPVDNDYICSNPTGSGLTPLIYGDLSSLQIGIGVKSLHNSGVLQVGGDIAPSVQNIYNIGNQNYPWKNIYLSNSLVFSSNSIAINSTPNNLNINASIAPFVNNTYNLGQASKKWFTGYFRNLVVDGVANINNLQAVNTNTYTASKFYLGVNNTLSPLYDDEGLAYGGVYLKSLNGREYYIAYFPPSSGMNCFQGGYNQSTFRTNTSFQVPISGYIKTNNIVSYGANLSNDNECFGLFFRSGRTYISKNNILNIDPILSNGPLAGIGNFNILSNSGSFDDHIFCLSAIESGVNVSQRFLSAIKTRTKDYSNLYRDQLRGFEIKYIDDIELNVQGALTDRLVFGSYNNTSKFVNGFTLMKDSSDGGVFGITNIPSITENILPNTIFNVRSKNNCIARFTAENNSSTTSSAIQLLGSYNCDLSGVEFSYLNRSGISDISMYKNTNKNIFIRMKDTNQIGILSSGIISDSTITIGHHGMAKLPSIALKDNVSVNSISVNGTSGYGKLFNLRTVKLHANQFNSLFYVDSSGTNFDLVVNQYDNLDGRAVFTDSSAGNTFAGYLSPFNRLNINSLVQQNTAYGFQSLYSINSGSGNIAIGCNALYSLTSGNNNIVLGSNSANGLQKTNNNIIIGNNSFNKSSQLSSTSGNIIIGHNGIGNSVSGSYNFIVGFKENTILLHGKIGPNNSDKQLIMPSGGKLYLNNSNDTESLHLENNTIEIIDSGGYDYPQNKLVFKFKANTSNDLLILDHSSAPLTNSANYASRKESNDIFITTPYAQFNSDVRIKGFIDFSDGTSLNTASGISYATNIAKSGVDIANSGINLINNIFIEGYMPSGLSAPVNFSSKTSGVLIFKNSNWVDAGSVFVINRDPTSIVHSGAYVIAARVNNEYKPIWVSAEDTNCCCP